ncbi:siroheme synthase CysG [Phreatobacter stygius]|uniref:Uroporphyrinogen-III C-methyltransferase n=1 Tax=Phreatobacter stygius TaxID=1940610 RepID=A0A4D7AXV6_9HYPH|nr:siroheme synthase CysG [Phreatobacter stygius]QCI65011.1 uroporphyrinogen-III C-methyltransferase [Phreatobacter stygius]
MSRFKFFPISYDVASRFVVVAGNGEQALQKLRLLVRTEARLVLCAPAPSAELAAFAVEHGIEHVTAEPDARRLASAALLFVATGDAVDDARLALTGRAAGVPVNVVDRPQISDFAVPAIVDRAPIAIAISTDGHAPVLAQKVRAAIEALLPPAFGRLGDLAAAIRETVNARLHDAGRRRHFWTRLFDGRAAAVALTGEVERAAIIAINALDGARAEAAPPGKVFLVGAGPGAEDLLTLRAHRLLQTADVIVHDALVPEAVIAMGRRDAERISVGKRKGRHSVGQAEIDALLVSLGSEGKQVVRLKAGDPMVFGRAGEEVAALRAAGIAYEIVPGITAALAAAADAAIPLTLRGVASQLIIATGHGAEGSEPEGWEKLAADGATVAVYMGKSVADRIVARLAAAGLAGATPVVAVENAGRAGRRLFAGTLAELARLAARDDLAGPVLIMIGQAVAHGDLADAEPFVTPLAAAA